MVKILIVDNSTYMRELLKYVLSELGYEDIIESSTGKGALQKFTENNLSLVLLSIVLPDIYGTKVLEQIRGSDKKVKVVMVTAIGQKLIVEECTELGVQAYILKPFKKKAVMKILKKVMKE
jgi:two-component system, chemotaxis family, chemotaxis protein CheY